MNNKDPVELDSVGYTAAGLLRSKIAPENYKKMFHVLTILITATV